MSSEHHKIFATFYNIDFFFESFDKKATPEEKSESSYWYCCTKEGENQSV